MAQPMHNLEHPVKYTHNNFIFFKEGFVNQGAVNWSLEELEDLSLRCADTLSLPYTQGTDLSVQVVGWSMMNSMVLTSGRSQGLSQNSVSKQTQWMVSTGDRKSVV